MLLRIPQETKSAGIKKKSNGMNCTKEWNEWHPTEKGREEKRKQKKKKKKIEKKRKCRYKRHVSGIVCQMCE